jgi:hypothetical protein
MNKIRRLAFTALATLVLAASQGLVADSARAATNPYTAQGVCGTGYVNVRTPVDLTVAKNGVYSVATLYLMYNRATGYNCVVLIKVSDVGVPTDTGVYVTANIEAPLPHDNGMFRYYASTKVYAPHTCVQYGGHATWGGAVYVSYGSDWVACN